MADFSKKSLDSKAAWRAVENYVKSNPEFRKMTPGALDKMKSRMYEHALEHGALNKKGNLYFKDGKKVEEFVPGKARAAKSQRKTAESAKKIKNIRSNVVGNFGKKIGFPINKILDEVRRDNPARYERVLKLFNKNIDKLDMIADYDKDTARRFFSDLAVDGNLSQSKIDTFYNQAVNHLDKITSPDTELPGDASEGWKELKKRSGQVTATVGAPLSANEKATATELSTHTRRDPVLGINTQVTEVPWGSTLRQPVWNNYKSPYSQDQKVFNKLIERIAPADSSPQLSLLSPQMNFEGTKQVTPRDQWMMQRQLQHGHIGPAGNPGYLAQAMSGYNLNLEQAAGNLNSKAQMGYGDFLNFGKKMKAEEFFYWNPTHRAQFDKTVQEIMDSGVRLTEAEKQAIDNLSGIKTSVIDWSPSGPIMQNNSGLIPNELRGSPLLGVSAALESTEPYYDFDVVRKRSYHSFPGVYSNVNMDRVDALTPEDGRNLRSIVEDALKNKYLTADPKRFLNAINKSFGKGLAGIAPVVLMLKDPELAKAYDEMTVGQWDRFVEDKVPSEVLDKFNEGQKDVVSYLDNPDAWWNPQVGGDRGTAGLGTGLEFIANFAGDMAKETAGTVVGAVSPWSENNLGTILWNAINTKAEPKKGVLDSWFSPTEVSP